MDESFTLTVIYDNKTKDYEAIFQPYGYSYRISIEIENTTLFFERDEERNFRAILPPDTGDSKTVDRNLVKAIGEKLEEVFG